MPRKARRSHTTDQKIALLKRHFIEKVPISNLPLGARPVDQKLGIS